MIDEKQIQELIKKYELLAKKHMQKQYEFEKEFKLGLAGKHRGKKEAYRTIISDLTNLLKQNQ